MKLGSYVNCLELHHNLPLNSLCRFLCLYQMIFAPEPSYLYNHPNFRSRIEMLRKQWQQSPGAVKRQMSDESKDAMIQLLRERIKELEGENKRLKGENKRLYGKIYEKV